LSVGTTLAYVLPAELPPAIGIESFRIQLRDAAQSLGLERAICMLDFMVRDGKAVMIEIAPRPGGDCLPPLILKSCGFDILGCALDFAERRPVTVPAPSRWKHLVGLRLFAAKPGVIRKLDDSPLRADNRVLECYLKRGPGHRVVLPPEDYDSRLLGHVIFKPSNPDSIESECLDLRAKLELQMESPQ
jgi:biotin carboxylase